MALPPNVKDAIVEIGCRLDQRGFIAGADGNISVRLDSGRILITPSGLPKGRLRPEDLVEISPAGTLLAGSRSASSEKLMHLFVYERRPEITACVHSHPPYTTAFAVAGKPLAGDVLPEVILAVGELPLTAYAATGTDEVPQALEPFIESHNAFLLRNHGLLTIGRTLEEAYNRHETVEHYARIVFLAYQLGGINALPDDEVRRLAALRRKFEQTAL